MPVDDGGPAFPRPHSTDVREEQCYSQEGMSLRDWFAMADAILAERKKNGG